MVGDAGDWLAEEAAHLERGLLRACAAHAQVRIELQVSRPSRPVPLERASDEGPLRQYRL